MTHYDQSGCRLTDCCGCYSTYMDSGQLVDTQQLCCKRCCRVVPNGQGDGSEHKVIDDLVLNDYLEDN